jgi:hypothetical protein
VQDGWRARLRTTGNGITGIQCNWRLSKTAA